MFDVMLRNDEKGRELDSDGVYHARRLNETLLDSQEFFCREKMNCN